MAKSIAEGPKAYHMSALNDFWNIFVLPSLEDWERHPTCIRRATIALCELDNLTEHFLQHQSPGTTRPQVAAAREELGRVHSYLALARDIHDTHKHGALTRKTATISKAQRPSVKHSGGALLNVSPLNSFAFNEPPAAVLIIIDDGGHSHDLTSIIKQCRDHWKREL